MIALFNHEPGSKMDLQKVEFTIATGKVVEVNPQHAQQIVREILSQLAPYVAMPAGDLRITKQDVADFLAKRHPANNRRAGRLWGCLRHAYNGSNITMMCVACGGPTKRIAHLRHDEADEYLSAVDVLAHTEVFLRGDVLKAGVAMIADFRYLCDELQQRLIEG